MSFVLKDKIFDLKKKRDEELEKKKALLNPEFISSHYPIGGISFRDEKIVKTGDGYETCLYVYKYPNSITDNWMLVASNQDDATVTFDIHTIEKSKVLKNIDRSMEEQSSRYATAKNHSERLQAQRKFQEAEAMHEEVMAAQDVMKSLVTRIYVSAKTLTELDEKVKDIKSSLDTTGYKSAVALNETKEDWQAITRSYVQQKGIKQKRGQEILSSQLAIGNPFYFSSLNDPCGAYYGDTYANTGGTVFLDLFRITPQRLSYNTLLMGVMGSGKSTTLKKMMLDRASRGDMVRVFDPAGEYTTLTESLGGKVIALDGSDGKKINALQIRKTDEDMYICYNNHISLLSSIYRTLNKDASVSEVFMLEKMLRELYELLHIVPGLKERRNEQTIEKDITALSPEEYPTWSNFLEFIKKKRKEEKEKGNEDTIEYQYISNIELAIDNLVNSYGNIFDGHSTIDDIYKEQIVCFNIQKLSKMKPEVFDVQVFIALFLCWDNCVHVGQPMKELYDNHKIRFEDIKRFLILIDESHRWVNAKKLPAVEQVLLYMREARKYFGGICLASQSIRDYVPDDATQEGVDQMKTLFELCTYKFIMQQDVGCRQKLGDIFSDQITSFELNKIATLSKGETILMISSDRNLHFKIFLSPEEERIYAGGA